MSDYAHPESLVNARWVAEHLADPAVCFVEVIWSDSGEWGRVAYCGGHIPGAVAWDFATELQDPGRNDIVDRAGFGALLGRSGIARPQRSWYTAGRATFWRPSRSGCSGSTAIRTCACSTAAATSGWPKVVP